MSVSPEEDDEGAARRDPDSENKKHDTFEKLTLATAIVGVVVLCVYTALTGYQAYIAKDSAQRQLRAYVSAAVDKQPIMSGPDQPEIGLVFKNNGQTPAYDLTTRMLISFGSGPLTSEEVANGIADFKKTTRRSSSTLFPGAEVRSSTQLEEGIVLSSEDKWTIELGVRTLWVFGEVEYVDAFSKPHFTHFRLYMRGPKMLRANKLVWAEEGNEAD
jgi:hypothetical protein